MGWVGPTDQLLYALSIAGADKCPDGAYAIYGESPVSFMGLGKEIAVPDGALYSVNGNMCSLPGLLNSTSYGLRNVTVIGG
jgi:hypothetical protein